MQLRSWFTAVLVAFVVGSALPSPAFGLGADYSNDQPVGGSDKWPVGLKELVNRPERVHGYFVNWEDVFFFAGDTDQLNAFLKAYTKLPETNLKIVLHPGKPEVKSPWDPQPREVAADWKLYTTPFTRAELEQATAKHEKLEPAHFTTQLDILDRRADRGSAAVHDASGWGSRGGWRRRQRGPQNRKAGGATSTGANRGEKMSLAIYLISGVGAALIWAGLTVSHFLRRSPQMPKRKSWREKLADSKSLPKTGRISGKMIKRWGTGTMVIPAPVEVDAIMRRVPHGRLITISEIRAKLAKKHAVTMACPITTGIFAWISAHAAEESAGEGKKNITPYWRTLKTGGELNPKYPGGISELRRRLKAEGHQVIAKGKRFIVADFEKSLVAG